MKFVTKLKLGGVAVVVVCVAVALMAWSCMKTYSMNGTIVLKTGDVIPVTQSVVLIGKKAIVIRQENSETEISLGDVQSIVLQK